MEKHSFSGNIIDIHNKTIYPGKVVYNEKIMYIERLERANDIYILPGLIDSHVHIESSMLTPAQFARIAVEHGVIAAIADPHEIANVLGLKGIDFMIDNGKTVPFKFFFGAPSCVPATPLEINGAIISSNKIEKLLSRNDIYFLAELMNFPGVINDDDEVINKINFAKKFKKPIDGHAPGLTGNHLIKYINAGTSTDHECTTYDEALEKIKLGMKIIIREGSAAKNFDTLWKLIDLYPEQVMLCTDDSHPDDLVNGYIKNLIKKGLNKGIDLFNLLKAAIINPVKHYRLPVGSLKVNDPADFIVIDNLKSFKVLQTVINGNIVFDGSKSLFTVPEVNSINLFKAKPIINKDIIIKNNGKPVQVINVIDKEIYTLKYLYTPNFNNEFIEPDIKSDILKLVYVNRYKDVKPQIGFARNFKLKKGAIAQSISHDSHNILSIGTNNNDIVKVINRLIELEGGIVIFNGSDFYELPLEIAGIMTNADGYEVAKKYEKLNQVIKEMGCTLTAPLMTLSFLALLVIPELKIGDKGLFDYHKFDFVDLFIE